MGSQSAWLQDEELPRRPALYYWWLVGRCLSAPRQSHRPRTPVRWLCLGAFRYLAASSGRSLEPWRLEQLGRLLELGVYLNRCFDGKAGFSPSLYRRLRRGLPPVPLREYLRQLRAIERGRPSAGNWSQVQRYRRAVIDLSLKTLFRLADLPAREVLSPLVCQIQLIDDILDQRLDRALGLPTLLTAGGPSAQQQARALWLELKSHSRASERPLVALGFPVYLLARVCALLSPRC